VHCFIATYDTKEIQHGALLLSTLPHHLAGLSKVFQAGCLKLFTDESFRRPVHQ